MSASPLEQDPLSVQIHSVAKFLTECFHKIPGSPIITRYIASSYQNDPFRSLLELFLLAFAIRTLAQSRTRASASGSNFVKLDRKEIDDLVSEFNPVPLCEPLSATEEASLASVPTIIGGNSAKPKVSLPSLNGGKPREVMNLASYNFTDLAGDEKVKEAAIQTLRTYGVGSCSPPGFYGTIDVHMALEADIARFLGTEKAIIYSQGFSTISSVIPAFSKRGDIIVADAGVNFAIQKGIQISRSTTMYYKHNDLDALEATLKSVVQKYKRKRPLTRRFIITEGVFENDGQITNLKRLVELKRKYKFRLILDEGLSFGTVGRTGRGLTEVFDVPATEVDMIVGSMANTLGAAGGFCAGSNEVVFHQRINGPAFVYSAALPALLAVSASVGINRLQRGGGGGSDDVLARLRENVSTLRGTLDGIESLYIPSAPESPLVHLQIRSRSDRHPNTSLEKFEAARQVVAPRDSNKSGALVDMSHDLAPEAQLQLLQAILDDCLEHGLFLILHRKLPSLKADVMERGVASRPSLRLAVTGGLTKKEMEKAAGIIRSAVLKVIGKRR